MDIHNAINNFAGSSTSLGAWLAQHRGVEGEEVLLDNRLIRGEYCSILKQPSGVEIFLNNESCFTRSKLLTSIIQNV